jgi:tRNA-modifying protein YgfZ
MRGERAIMADMQAAILGDRAVVAVSGPAARDFLQGIVTVDIADVAPGTARHGALLTPQGKILFEFMVTFGGDDAFLLDVARPLARDLVKRLMFYRLRAKVEIAARDDLTVVSLWGGTAPDFEVAFADPRLAALGWRAILPADEAPVRLAQGGAEIVDRSAYHAYRIALGVPELGADYATGELFPHESDLDQLAGVDFDKGCFVGQEVVSRMQHRGTLFPRCRRTS